MLTLQHEFAQVVQASQHAETTKAPTFAASAPLSLLGKSSVQSHLRKATSGQTLWSPLHPTTARDGKRSATRSPHSAATARGPDHDRIDHDRGDLEAQGNKSFITSEEQPEPTNEEVPEAQESPHRERRPAQSEVLREKPTVCSHRDCREDDASSCALSRGSRKSGVHRKQHRRYSRSDVTRSVIIRSITSQGCFSNVKEPCLTVLRTVGQHHFQFRPFGFSEKWPPALHLE